MSVWTVAVMRRIEHVDRLRMKPKQGLRLRLIWGTPRRLIWNLFRPKYVQRKLAERTGKCLRCGACCQLVWKCPHFTIADDLPSCKIYSLFRPPNCSNFPIDHYDLADRNEVLPDVACGYSWAKKSMEDDRAREREHQSERNVDVAAAATVER